MDTEIKKALKIDSLDINKCVAILEDLSVIPVNPLLLRKYPAIMTTIKKCRKFSKSDAIRQKAEVIYHKFKSFFLAEDAGKLLEPKSKLRENKENEVAQTSVDSSVSAGAVSSSGITNGIGTNSSPNDAGDKTEQTCEAHASSAVSTSSDLNGANTVTEQVPVGDAKSLTTHINSTTANSEQSVSLAIPEVDTDNTSALSTNSIFEKVVSGSLSSTQFIPGLGDTFQEGVDYKASQSLSVTASPSATQANSSTSDTDNSAPKKDLSAHPSHSDKPLAGEPVTFDPRRPLSLPLPPTVGEDELDEDDDMDIVDSNIEEAHTINPIIPDSLGQVNSFLSNMVSNAVRQITALDRLTSNYSTAPPVAVDSHQSLPASISGRRSHQSSSHDEDKEVLELEDDDEELLESKRRDLNARIEELMRQEQEGMASDEEEDVAAGGGDEAMPRVEEAKRSQEEEEEPLIDDDELHNLLGV
uniref:Lens epithelium-derived growth factor integrase-binding domain-containing protein n=1 Tax=Biomphalaria glabrata TaxID=6526 RepID=A0A2C9KAN9_BIOGL